MCRTCGNGAVRDYPPAPAARPAAPGEQGFVYLQYTGEDAKTEFGKVTGSRYPFWERPVLLVDRRDAQIFLAGGHFQEVSRE